jgi:hypothetical protein
VHAPLTLALLAWALAPVLAQTRSVPGASDRAPDPPDAQLSGVVTAGAAPLAGVRVTVFRPDLSFFRETRTAADGSYEFAPLPRTTLRVGFAQPGLAYVEQSALSSAGANVLSPALGPEAEIGSWDVIGDTAPETFDATDIGVLLPDGRLFFCHDTTNPILFDPLTGQKELGTSSSGAQGCMNSTLLDDGSVLLLGGQDGAAPGSFVNGILGYAPIRIEYELPSQ